MRALTAFRSRLALILICGFWPSKSAASMLPPAISHKLELSPTYSLSMLRAVFLSRGPRVNSSHSQKLTIARQGGRNIQRISRAARVCFGPVPTHRALGCGLGFMQTLASKRVCAITVGAGVSRIVLPRTHLAPGIIPGPAAGTYRPGNRMRLRRQVGCSGSEKLVDASAGRRGGPVE